MALIIGLVMLLLLTVIMISAVRVTSLEERLAGNLQNHNIAFQAAESALREAEAFIESGDAVFNPLRLSNGPFQNSTAPICVAGICGTTIPLQSDNIADANAGSQAASTGISTIYAEPVYMIELVRTDPSLDSSRIYATFRITTRARGGDDSSIVQLQTTYRLHALSFVL